MIVELSAFAAGLPMAASFAMASGFVALREGRRRSALNAAMHELRRPLQAISLSLPSQLEGESLASSLEMAVAAVERLDREINGSPAEEASEPLSPRSIVEAAVARWEPLVLRAGRTLRLEWSGDDPVLNGDRVAIAQGLDNLISNALEHGGGTIDVEAKVVPGLLHVVVRDGGRLKVGTGRAGAFRRVPLDGRDRHGHGLAIVRRMAVRHGGSFRLRRSAVGSEARLALPLSREVV